ncbi:MAG: dockerin type I domain-containing protein [Planctomycetota bacterium]|nr:dockerin type I domain-containing protein [Planctomycetota bacterium]
MFSGISLFGIGNTRKSRKEKNHKRIGQQRRERRRHLLVEQLEDRRLLANISINDVTAAEPATGTASFDFTVTQSVATPGETVAFTIAGVTANVADIDNSGLAGSTVNEVTYDPISGLAGIVSFNGTGTTRTISVRVAADTLVEGDQTFTVTLSGATGGATITFGFDIGDGTITDADSASVAFQVATTTIGEDAASSDVVVVLTTGAGNTLENAATFNVVATDITTVAADYAVPATITFNAGSGDADATPDVPLTFDPASDTLVEGDQSVTLTLTVNAGVATVTGGTQNVVTITDADSASVAFQVATTTIGEDAASSDVVVVLTTGAGNTLENAATFNVVATDITTVAADYAVPATITFNAGSGNADATPDVPLTFNPASDTLVEGNQSVTLTLTVNAGAATVTGGTQNVVTITDADSASLSIAATTTVAEGGGVQTINVTLTTSSATLEAGVTISADVVEAAGSSASSGTDFTALSTQTVTFSGGDGNGTIKTVSITPLDDLRVEGTEVVNLTLQNLVDSPSSVASSLVTTSGAVSITDNDSAMLSFATASSNEDENNTTHSVNVTLTLSTTGSVGLAGLDRTVTIQVNQTGGTATKSPTMPTDYAYTNTLLTFAASPPVDGTSFTQSVSATIVEDILDDDAETIILSLQSLSDDTGGQVSQPAPQTHTITINDDDTASPVFDATVAGTYSVVIVGGNRQLTGPMGTISAPFVSGSTLTFNGSSGNDIMMVDFTGGGHNVIFHGNDGNDDLTVDGGGPYGSVTYNATGLGAGNLVFTTPTATVSFTGLEPTTVVPVAGVVTINVGDGLAHTATFTAVAGNNLVTFDSVLESLTFANPSVELIVNADAGSDIFTFMSLDSGFKAAITVNGSTGTDQVDWNATGLTLGSGTSTGNVNFAVENIHINQGITTTGGGTGAVTLNGTTVTIAALGDISADGAVSITAGGGISTAGDVTTTTDNVTLVSATTLTGPVAIATAGGNIAFNSTLNGAPTLGLTAGAGNIDFDGIVGGITPLGAVSIVSAANVTADLAFSTASFSQSAGSGTTTLTGLLTTTAVAGVSLTGKNLVVTGGITTGGTGPVTIIESGTVSIAGTGDINADGTVSITGAGGISTAGDVTTTNDNVTFVSATTLTGPVAITTAGGNIAFNSTLNGTTAVTGTLSLTAGTGDVTIEGAIGTTKPLSGLTIAANDVALNGIGTAPATAGVTDVVSVTATTAGADIGSITFNGTGYISEGASTYTVADTALAGEDLTVLAGVTIRSTTDTVTLNGGDNITIPGGSTVQAAKMLTINGDTGDAVDSAGSIINLFGNLSGGGTTPIVVNGNVDDDMITLQNMDGIVGKVSINGGGQGPSTRPIWDGGALSPDTTVGCPIPAASYNDVRAGHSTLQSVGDTLNVSDGSDTDNNSYWITNSLVVRNTDQPRVSYNDIESLNLIAGIGNDRIAIFVPGAPPAPVLPKLITVIGSAGTDQLDVAGSVLADRIVVGNLVADPSVRAPIEVATMERLHIYGDVGDDFLVNDSSVQSVMEGDAGNDVLVGGSSTDVLFGGAGIDRLFGRNGNDYVFSDQDATGSGHYDDADFLDGTGSGNDSYAQYGTCDQADSFTGSLVGAGAVMNVVTWLMGAPIGGVWQVQADSLRATALTAANVKTDRPPLPAASASGEAEYTDPAHNAANAFDVNADGDVTPLDVLLVTNRINQLMAAEGEAILAAAPSSAARFYYDVNEDHQVTPIDVLLTINRLNETSAGEGEGVTLVGPQADLRFAETSNAVGMASTGGGLTQLHAGVVGASYPAISSDSLVASTAMVGSATADRATPSAGALADERDIPYRLVAPDVRNQTFAKLGATPALFDGEDENTLLDDDLLATLAKDVSAQW